MLEGKNITKIYKDGPKMFTALSNINFELNEGDHLAILGTNGSGKTTLIKIISQLTQPTIGKLYFQGKRLNPSHRGNFGVMFGSTLIYYRLTVQQNLEYYASLYNVRNPKEKIEEMLRQLGIIDKQYSYVESLSEGQKHKVAFARAIINSPKILVLDEPTNGVDPISTDILHWHIKKFPTLIFSSHNLYEVMELANKLLVINQGHMAYFGDIKEFKKSRNSEEAKKELMQVYDIK